MENQENYPPLWLKKGSIDEVKFCQQFRAEHDVVFADGAFFTTEGRISDERVLRQWIYEMLCDHVGSNVSRKVDSLLGALRLECAGTVANSPRRIHVANGTYDLLGEFSPLKQHCRHRIRARYDPTLPYPQRWLDFLDDLLEPEDILTLQEYLGYCLIPTTIAQKMLIITGHGGEGKSRIGVVMQHMLGSSMSVGSLNKVETNRFARADLEHLLLMVDDDLKLQALTDTNYIKSIITAETPMDLERKGQQSYQGMLNVRFLAFGNDTLQALHDRSYGFFRRQIILTAKPVRPDRENDPFLAANLKKEIDGIFLWCLAGLHRLMDNQFCFTLSPKAQENLQRSMHSGNNVLSFLQSQGYFCFDAAETVTSRLFYSVYRSWCEDNMLIPLSANSFSSFLCQNQERYGIQATNKVRIGNGKYARGFTGIRALPRL